MAASYEIEYPVDLDEYGREIEAKGCLPDLVAIRAVRVDDDATFPARILEVYGPDGGLPLSLERSVVVANDGGKWVFETSGVPHAFENQDAYGRTSKAARFTGEMLDSYLRALGVPDSVRAVVARRPAAGTAVMSATGTIQYLVDELLRSGVFGECTENTSRRRGEIRIASAASWRRFSSVGLPGVIR